MQTPSHIYNPRSRTQQIVFALCTQRLMPSDVDSQWTLIHAAEASPKFEATLFAMLPADARGRIRRASKSAGVICAKAGLSTPVDFTESPALPSDIQFLPPGERTITATHDGQPTTVRVKGTPQTAARLQAQLQPMLDAARAGAGDYPFFDFNHDDAEASGHPVEFYWGGDDPHKGGVRARVNWTAKGREALAGRAYRRFSPSFFADASGEVTGAPVNMGGLVNRAAFIGIQPIVP